MGYTIFRHTPIFAIVSSRYSRIFCRRPQTDFTRHESKETTPQNHGHSLFLLLDLAGSPTIVKQIRGKHVEHIIKFRQKPHQSYPTMARKMCCCDLPLEIRRNTKKFPWWTCIWTRRCIVPLNIYIYNYIKLYLYTYLRHTVINFWGTQKVTMRFAWAAKGVAMPGSYCSWSSEAGCLMNFGMIFQRLALYKSDFGEAMGSHSQSLNHNMPCNSGMETTILPRMGFHRSPLVWVLPTESGTRGPCQLQFFRGSKLTVPIFHNAAEAWSNWAKQKFGNWCLGT